MLSTWADGNAFEHTKRIMRVSLRVEALKEGEGDRKQEGDLFGCILS